MRAGVLAFLISLAVCSATCLADGKIFRRSAEPAPMPNQAAILTWVDGVQTLVIQTRFESRSQAEAAWVVPAPSVPEVFEVEPGVIESARAQFNPRVERSPPLVHPALVVVGLWLVGGLHLVLAAKGTTAEKLVCFVVLVCVSFVALDVGTARTRGLSASGAPKVDVLRIEPVGSYDVAVISSPDATALRGWLIEFGVTISPEETSVIDAYAKQGWCFVASKLRMTGETLPAPHPLGLRFAAESPVYPMRLTGVGNDVSGNAVSLELELLVYGNGTASVSGMKVVSSGPLEFDDERLSWRLDDRIQLAHDGVKPLAKGATWGTRLAGFFTPEAMREDIRVSFTPSAIISRTVADRADRPMMIAVACGLAVAIAGVLAVPLTSKRLWTKGRFTSVACATSGLAIILTIVSVVPKTFVRTERDRAFGRDDAGDAAWYEVIEAGADSVEEAQRTFHQAWDKDTENAGTNPVFGEGPGEYSIVERNSEFVCRRVDGNGRQTTVEFTAVPKRIRSATPIEIRHSSRVTPAMDEASKIEALLVTLERSDAMFIRSGSEYDGRRAAEHLRTKLQSVDRAITAMQFIDGIASKSSLSGKPYQVRQADGTTTPSRDLFLKKLRTIEAEPPK
jgi:hypothetical protein